MSILNTHKISDFEDLIDLCGFSNYKNEIVTGYKDHLKAHKLNLNLPQDHNVGKLDHRWYNSVDISPDYSVYSDMFYLCDIWLCWCLYSRNSIKALLQKNGLINTSVVEYLKDMKSVADLGCGFGFTTAALKEIFPCKNIYGTNLKESFQFNIADKIGKQHGFKVVDGIKDISNCDIVFASEYFEHFERPVEHLHEVVTKLNPKVFILANGFNGHAIGHFNFYKHKDSIFENTKASKFFNESLKHYRFNKLKSKIWNNRPSIWIR